MMLISRNSGDIIVLGFKMLKRRFLVFPLFIRFESTGKKLLSNFQTKVVHMIHGSVPALWACISFLCFRYSNPDL